MMYFMGVRLGAGCSSGQTEDVAYVVLLVVVLHLKQRSLIH